MDEALDAVLLESTSALDRLGLPYAIVGGLAVSVWAVPRATRDLVLLKAFSDRPRDFEDLTTLFSHLGDRLDQAYIEQWARMLDESVGTSEVTTRIEHARVQSDTGSRVGR